MKTDELGEYDEDKVPKDLRLPVKIDRENDALSGEDNLILMRFNFSSETVPAGFARRRAEFLARLVNGELLWSGGGVLRRVSEQWQDGQLVVTFIPVEKGFNPVVQSVQDGVKSSGNGSNSDLPQFVLDQMGKTDKNKFEVLRRRFERFIGKMKEKHAGVV